MKRCVIFGAVQNTCDTPHIESGDYVIAADAGYLTLKKLGIKPDLVVGDFDSLGEKPGDVPAIRYPVEKDDTDTLIAVKTALRKGFDDFLIYGCIGGRLDQTLASIQTVLYITERGGTACLVSGETCVTAVKNGEILFKSASKGVISVFSLSGKSSGVYLTNLLFPLTDAVITPDYPLGVSNKFTGKEASVKVNDGILAVLWNGSPDDIKEYKTKELI